MPCFRFIAFDLLGWVDFCFGFAVIMFCWACLLYCLTVLSVGSFTYLCDWCLIVYDFYTVYVALLLGRLVRFDVCYLNWIVVACLFYICFVCCLFCVCLVVLLCFYVVF